MASTRNKNTKEDYLLEQKMNHGRQNYIHYTNSSSGKAYDDKLFYLVQIQADYQEKLSKTVDTESHYLELGLQI